MTEIVAERIFQKTDSALSVIARIFAPEKIRGSSEWSCKIEVQGLDQPFGRSVIGVDSFQVLYLGLRALCVHLEKYEARLKFLDGSPGDGGLPLIMPCPAFFEARKLPIHSSQDS
jgi:hypothetical protein